MAHRLMLIALAVLCALSVVLLAGPSVPPVDGLSHAASGSHSALQRAPMLFPRASAMGASLVPMVLDTGYVRRDDRLPHGAGLESLPARWDWRAQGKVTSVKDQGACNASYAFAAIAGLESRLLLDDAGGYDFSENHAKECNWEAVNNYDDPLVGSLGTCNGGNARMIANLLSQGGAVLESCDSYEDYDAACNSTCPYQKTVLGWRLISGEAIPPAEVLKWYVHTYGPLQTTMYAGYGDDWHERFALYDGSYTLYYPGTEEPNLCVLIVGWDDGLTHDGGTGGWIVKNSRGPYWGGPCGYGSEGGYFTIAYGSASIGMHSSFFAAWQDYDATGEILYYDEAGWNEEWGYGNTTAWALCRFTPRHSGHIVGVEFWTTDATTDVDVYLYDSFDGVGPRDLRLTQPNLSFDEAGYHSVTVPSLPVVAGDEVVALVKLTNMAFSRPIAADVRGPAAIERTYISRDGTDGSWEDVGMVNSDLTVRLRLSGVVAVPTETLTPAPTATASVTPTPTPSPTLTATSIVTPTPTETLVTRRIYLPLMQRSTRWF